MGSAYIESAFYGDERSMRNITSILSDRVTGTSLDVDVNEQLIPAFAVAPKTELTTQEERRIREQASTSCGGVDQECITATEARLRQAALAAKERAANTSAGVIKGRRLTVNVVDGDGKRQRLVVPDGQKFKLDNVSITDPKKGPVQLPTLAYVQNQMYLIGAIVLGTVIYVFSVMATYTVFMKSLTPLFAIPLTVIAVLIPYSGYAMILLYFLFVSAADTYVNLSTPRP